MVSVRRIFRSNTAFAYLLLAPTLVMVFSLVIYPFIDSVRVSLYFYSLMRPGDIRFVGFGNYAKILTEPFFYRTIRVSAIYSAATVLLSMLLGLWIALVFNEEFKPRGIFRSLILIPWAIPPALSGIMWRWVLNSNFGALNGLLFEMGLIKQGINWLGRPDLALVSVIISDLWQNTPFCVLMLLPFLQTVPIELIEASKLDGAGSWATFRHVTMPYIKSGLLIVVVLRVMGALQTFDRIYSLTMGGPGGATEVLVYYTWLKTFGSFMLGEGAALSYIIGMMIMALTFVFMKYFYVEE